jgi:hypothetical protein
MLWEKLAVRGRYSNNTALITPLATHIFAIFKKAKDGENKCGGSGGNSGSKDKK